MNESRETSRRAVALRYDAGRDGAPNVVAKGKGETARRILELAEEHGVPVREDRDLLELLAALDVGEEIPLELYAAVAELLAYLWRLNDSRGPTMPTLGEAHADRAHAG